MKNKWEVILVLFTLLYFTAAVRNLLAASSSYINATVKVSICGNEIKEGGEDCDDIDLAGNSCSTVGYTSGILSCDASCEFDKTLCVFIPTSTPSPSPTPTITSTPTPTTIPLTGTPGPTSTSTPQPSSTNSPSVPTTSNAPLSNLLKQLQRISLPPQLAIYDLDNDGTISKEEFYLIMEVWVSNWRNNVKSKIKSTEKCDVNNDNVCNVKDLSVILYYIRI